MMIPILVAMVLITSQGQINVGEEFNASITVTDANDLAAFQIDLSYSNLEIVKVSRGNAIKNWSIFDFDTISSNKIRVIAAKFGEESIGEGEILNLVLRAKENTGVLSLDGILSDSNGNKIDAMFGNLSVDILTTQPESTYTQPIITPVMEEKGSQPNEVVEHWIVGYWYVIVLILIGVGIGVWKWRT
ncbi:hypothetical protein Asulf_01462 [Archaeoglobus sulfaticallidus PM70-1]|uniref:Cohesin domain-containing protein n=1 Tax=Archaeoglobus sulfaticallidus PM70-1 TaxID=387631 RepID=N0BMF2_9EURY|nr:cohesin domain-containing protein [Archaeoglobus sulfaticallidus]AGK61445.1 hypothetical protein Asulf_01462 [Archaeoglobus sulfaticallidus PM70-1]